MPAEAAGRGCPQRLPLRRADAKKLARRCSAIFHQSHQKFIVLGENVPLILECVWVPVLRDHRLKNGGVGGRGSTTDCTHWKPQTPFPDLSFSPTLSAFSRNSPLQSNHRGHGLQSLHPFTRSLHPPLVSFHPSSFTWPAAPLHPSLSATHHLWWVRTTFLIVMPHRPRQTLVKTIICSNTSRLYLMGPSTPPSPPPAQRKRTYNSCLFSPNVRPVPSRSSCLQTSDHRALMGGLRGNSYHTTII